jgi:predicted nucleic acid-binding protein
MITDDHRVRSIDHLQDPLGGFIANVEVSDVVDRPLYDALLAAGLKNKHNKKRQRESDALHLMYAVHDKCAWFVTLDPHFLDIRPTLAPLCRGLKIVKPSELDQDLTNCGTP